MPDPRLSLVQIGRLSLRICVPRLSLETRGAEAQPRGNREAEPRNEGKSVN